MARVREEKREVDLLRDRPGSGVVGVVVAIAVAVPLADEGDAWSITSVLRDWDGVGVVASPSSTLGRAYGLRADDGRVRDLDGPAKEGEPVDTS